jgi:hypothetical protein
MFRPLVKMHRTACMFVKIRVSVIIFLYLNLYVLTLNCLVSVRLARVKKGSSFYVVASMWQHLHFCSVKMIDGLTRDRNRAGKGGGGGRFGYSSHEGVLVQEPVVPNLSFSTPGSWSPSSFVLPTKSIKWLCWRRPATFTRPTAAMSVQR